MSRMSTSNPNYLPFLARQVGDDKAREDLELANTLAACDLRPVQQRLSRLNGWAWWREPNAPTGPR